MTTFWAVVPAVILVVVTLAAVVVILLERRKESREAGTNDRGVEITWQLDSRRSTVIISNKRLASIQRLRDRGGILVPSDLVVVWAQQFLDHDILYETVRENLHGTIRYLYVLDRVHADSVRELLDRLYEEEDPTIVAEGIDVVFVKPQATMNNFVLMAPGREHQEFYSGMIYDERPFAWVRQTPFRAKLFLRKVRHLVASVSIAQYLDQSSVSGESAEVWRGLMAEGAFTFDVEDQQMNFSDWARSEGAAPPDKLDGLKLDLQAFSLSTTLPPSARSKIADLGARFRSEGRARKRKNGGS